MLDSPYQWNTGVDGVVDAYAAMVYRLLPHPRPDGSLTRRTYFRRYSCGILKRNEPLRTRNTVKAWLDPGDHPCAAGNFGLPPLRRRTVLLDETLPFEMPEESAVHAALLSPSRQIPHGAASLYFEGFSANEIATATGSRPPPSDAAHPGTRHAAGKTERRLPG